MSDGERIIGQGLADALYYIYYSTPPFIRNGFLQTLLVSSRPWQGNAGHGSGGFCLVFDGVVDDGHQDVEHNDEGEGCPTTQGEADDAEEDKSVAQLVAF